MGETDTALAVSKRGGETSVVVVAGLRSYSRADHGTGTIFRALPLLRAMVAIWASGHDTRYWQPRSRRRGGTMSRRKA